MAEAQQPFVRRLDAREELGYLAGRSDRPQHRQHPLGGSPAHRPGQRGDTGRDGRVWIHMRGPDRAHGGRRSVLLVVGMQHKQHVQRALDDRVRGVAKLAHPKHHRQQVPRVAEVILGVHVRQPLQVAVGEGRQGRQLRQQANYLPLPGLLVVHLVGVGIETGERTDRRGHHRDRTRVIPESLDEPLDVLMDEVASADLVQPRLVLRRGRQLPFDQQIRQLEEARTLAKRLDPVAAVLEDPGLPIDICDRAATHRGARKARVVQREPTRPPPQLRAADRTVLDRQLEPLPRAVVDHGQRAPARQSVGPSRPIGAPPGQSCPHSCAAPLAVGHLTPLTIAYLTFRPRAQTPDPHNAPQRTCRSALRQPRSVPHPVGHLHNKSRLVRLLLAREHVTVDRREEPASGRETELVQIDIARCLIDPPDQHVAILELAALCRDETEYDDLPVRNSRAGGGGRPSRLPPSQAGSGGWGSPGIVAPRRGPAISAPETATSNDTTLTTLAPLGALDARAGGRDRFLVDPSCRRSEQLASDILTEASTIAQREH